MSIIPLCEPNISEDEITLVVECLQSGDVARGPMVYEFERRMGAIVHSPHAVAVSSGTAALHLALLAVGVTPGTVVITSDLTFVATVNAIRYCGATPLLVDCLLANGQMDVELVRHAMAAEQERGYTVSALLPVHLLGHAVDMTELLAVQAEYGVPIVEDATQALGTWLEDQQAYAGTVGDIGVYSFNGNKLITCGGGGMCVTKSLAHADLVRYLARQAKEGGGEYIHGTIGFNYRLPNLNAALGYTQAARLAEFLQAKRRIAARYADGVRDLPGVRFIHGAPYCHTTAHQSPSSFWLSTLLIDPDVCGRSARALQAFLRARGIETRTLYQPMHLSPSAPGQYAAQVYVGQNATQWYEEGLHLPSSTALTDAEQDTVIAAIRRWRVMGEEG